MPLISWRNSGVDIKYITLISKRFQDSEADWREVCRDLRRMQVSEHRVWQQDWEGLLENRYKKTRREIDMQSFDCRKNTTLNAGALANGLAGLAELPGLKAAMRVLIFDYLMRAYDNQTLSAKLLGRSRYSTCRRSFGCRESANEMRSGDCFFQS